MALHVSLASMGATRTPKSYLDAQLTYERTQDDGSVVAFRVLRSACVGNRVYYAATQPFERRDGAETAQACRRYRLSCPLEPALPASGEHFGYKDMDENMGPCEADCPESVLALLGPTNSEHALEWRRRCFDNLALRKRSIADGMIDQTGDAYHVHQRVCRRRVHRGATRKETRVRGARWWPVYHQQVP